MKTLNHKKEMLYLQLMVALGLGVLGSIIFYFLKSSDTNFLTIILLSFSAAFSGVFYKIVEVRIVISVALFVLFLVSLAKMFS